jgi:glycosyltransferase involved in cell wall biosynthesis
VAIEVAKRAGIPLKIAAKVDDADREYFEAVIKPRLSPPDIEFIGEVNRKQKNEFLGNALALLFTIDWPEPFGLTMIEAMACGTPVIARPCGSVPEVITDGVNGYIAAELDELVAAVGRVNELSRERCRAEFERRFTAETMVDNYEAVYEGLIAAHGSGQRITRAATVDHGPTREISRPERASRVVAAAQNGKGRSADFQKLYASGHGDCPPQKLPE